MRWSPGQEKSRENSNHTKSKQQAKTMSLQFGLRRAAIGGTSFAAKAANKNALGLTSLDSVRRFKSTDAGDVIGIDLGTTNSCVAIMVSRKHSIEFLHKHTSSYVAGPINIDRNLRTVRETRNRDYLLASCKAHHLHHLVSNGTHLRNLSRSVRHASKNTRFLV